MEWETPCVDDERSQAVRTKKISECHANGVTWRQSPYDRYLRSVCCSAGAVKTQCIAWAIGAFRKGRCP